MDSLIQGIIQNWFSDLIKLAVMAAITFALTKLNAKYPQWGAHARYALMTFVLLALLIFTFTGRAIFAPPISQEVTPENVEANIKIWADHLAISYQRKDVPDGDFFYGTVTVGNIPIDVFRVKGKPGYLQMKGTLNFAAQHQSAMAKLSERDFSQFVNQLNLEVARLKLTADVGLIFDQKTKQPIRTTIVLDKGIPIAGLSEGIFSSQVDDINGDINQLKAFVNAGLATDTTKEILSAQ